MGSGYSLDTLSLCPCYVKVYVFPIETHNKHITSTYPEPIRKSSFAYLVPHRNIAHGQAI